MLVRSSTDTYIHLHITHTYVLVSWAKNAQNCHHIEVNFPIFIYEYWIYMKHTFSIFIDLKKMVSNHFLRLLLFGLRSPVVASDTNKLFNYAACGPFSKCSNHFIQFGFSDLFPISSWRFPLPKKRSQSNRRTNKRP